MFKTKKRDKVLNAIIFFAENTEYLGKLKLFKLLFMLDFAHFRKTGRTVTGMEYSAWEFGPVPNELMEEWERPEDDFLEAIRIEQVQVIDYVRQNVAPKRHFDDSNFTNRELRIMNELAEAYGDVRSPEMIDITHEENGAWSRVWQNGEGKYRFIPYSYAIPDDDPSRDAILQASFDYEAILRAQRR